MFSCHLASWVVTYSWFWLLVSTTVLTEPGLAKFESSYEVNEVIFDILSAVDTSQPCGDDPPQVIWTEFISVVGLARSWET